MKRLHYILFLILTSLACKAISFSPTPPAQTIESATLPSTAVNSDPALTDPNIEWSTFLNMEGFTIWDSILNKDGDIYVLAVSKYNKSKSEFKELYLLKLGSNGEKKWETFISEVDFGNTYSSLAVDSDGNVYVSGKTHQEWGNPITPFFVHGRIQKDTFIAKINENGSIVWNTFLGDSEATTLTIDEFNNIYIIKFDADTVPERSFILVKIDQNGNVEFNDVKISLDIEANSLTIPRQIEMDNEGNILVTGEWDGPSRGDPNYYEPNCFLGKITSAGDLLWNIPIGGEFVSSPLPLNSIKIDQNGNIFLLGDSYGTWGTPLNDYDGGEIYEDPEYSFLNGRESFLAKIDKNGNSLWHTFFSKNITVSEGAVDSNGNFFVVGSSDKTWGEPKNKYINGTDSFVAQIDTNGSVLWNTFIGGDGNDYLNTILLDDALNVYVFGHSTAIFGSPITPPLLSEDNGHDLVAVKISLH